ncbi:hypothetical protein GWI33_008690 [Rhynchophorus ferrugineus]|uniref:Uncharacterized protein n=1 Tax=Rhynchophorus ferrugineus TaxID=354439 RepID=A0A834IFT3_RHYFE|nr:hypothetical protein GWI33_008690 [Rhynchophorus ferrugineus]
MSASPLKIIFNEDCIDLRHATGTRPRKSPHRYRKAILNDHPPFSKPRSNPKFNSKTLSKLSDKTKSYNYSTLKRTPQDVQGFKSVSELTTAKKELDTISSSSPILSGNNEESFLAKKEPYQNKFTMTKSRVNEHKKDKIKSRFSVENEDLLEDLTRDPVLESLDEPPWKDKRLTEKYSLLQVPWKRSRTFPLFSVSSSMKTAVDNVPENSSDKKTYLYDDGSEIDSTYFDAKRLLSDSHRVQSHWLTLLQLSSYLCALLITSLLIWLLSDNSLFSVMVMPKQPENPLKKFLKLFGGGALNLFTRFIRLFGTVLAIPTQDLYQPNPDLWAGQR